MAAIENDNEYTRRAKSYLRAVLRAENRFWTRSLYRKRLQDIAKSAASGSGGAVGDGYLIVPEDLPGHLADLDRELKEDQVHLQALQVQTWDLLSQLSHPKAQNCWRISTFTKRPFTSSPPKPTTASGTSIA